MASSGHLDFVLALTAIPFYITGLIGNILVIRIVHKTREMRTTTNYLLVNLAVGDITTILLGPLVFTSTLEGYLSNELTKRLCKLAALVETAAVSSAFSLTVLAVERYHAILQRFRTGLRLNEENIKKAIAIIWISSAVLCLPDFVLHEWSEFHSTCVGPWSLYMNKATKVCMIVKSVLVTYIPLLIILYCYGSLIRGIYFTNTVCPDTTEERGTERDKLVTTFIMVTTGFFICYAPVVVFNDVVASKDKEDIDLKLYADFSLVFNFVFMCSLCLNPILYAFRSRRFQEGFKRIIFCRESTSQNNDFQL